ncbi:GNAT family N-acetyltransferase [Tenacibaculum caenipelagi]|uniref:Acetyltransferase (GNAT) family protein n=1 Tax=Tenacibaculum caenipelagi TaxID=1325435 RepID=A0A4R6TH30_9FLAO|nr:GNAT family N-acetyltransferase [Tenacibaculum caenipelagi]TDQ28439.1 acetyltransferase (GNAT) family protein [Tenacibaculum caenipelagi]
MNTIIVRQAEKEEIDWINAQYLSIDFKPSNFENEYIVIAEIDGKKCGLGRLVKIDKQNTELGGIYVFNDYRGLGVTDVIVQFLCKNNPFLNTIVWCLPFENLQDFYGKFGFIKQKLIPPKEIAKKHEWCNTSGIYSKKVLLLSKSCYS